MICNHCKIQKTKYKRKTCEECKIIYEKSQQKTCSKCDLVKSWNEFGKAPSLLFGLQSICKLCASIKKYNRFNQSEDSFFGRIFSSCKSNLNNKKRDLGEFTLTLEQLKNKWVAQNGKCFISGVKMSTGVHVHFKCSPERIDNTISYTDENVVLIIAELNIGGSKQFSRDLLMKICQPDTEDHPSLDEINTLGEKKANTVTVNPPLITKTNKQQEILYQCVDCKSFDLVTNFTFKDRKTQRRNRKCKVCERIECQQRSITIHGKLNRMIGHAKHATTQRNTVRLRCKTSFEITKIDLINLIQTQRGKCAYSHKNLSFDGKSPFHISLERKDVNIGYTKDNIVFICEELNSSNMSAIESLHNQEKAGHSGWSVEKFAKFREQVNTQDIIIGMDVLMIKDD